VGINLSIWVGINLSIWVGIKTIINIGGTLTEQYRGKSFASGREKLEINPGKQPFGVVIIKKLRFPDVRNANNNIFIRDHHNWEERR